MLTKKLNLLKLELSNMRTVRTLNEMDDGLLVVSKNVYFIRDKITELYLNGNKAKDTPTICIDTDQLLKVMKISWSVSADGYAQSTAGQMHRFVTNTTGEKSIDHINRITFDNRLCNLRYANHKQNLENFPVFSKNSNTGLTGISKTGNTYQVQFIIDGERIRKTFRNIDDAILHRFFLIRIHNTHHLLNNQIISENYTDEQLLELTKFGLIDEMLIQHALKDNALSSFKHMSWEKPEQRAN